MRRLLAILLLLSSSALAAPAFVQKTTGINTVGVGNVVSGSITTSAGNLLFALVAENPGTGISNCTGQGATWTLLASVNGTGTNAPDLHVFYAKNIPGATGAVTCNALAAQWMSLLVIEYSGLDTSVPIDTFVSCDGNVATTTPSCGPVTPIWDAQLVVGVWGAGTTGTAPTANAPFTLRVGANNGNEGSLRSDAAENVLANDSSAQTPSFTTANVVYCMVTVLLKGSGANRLVSPQRRGGVVSQ